MILIEIIDYFKLIDDIQNDREGEIISSSKSISAVTSTSFYDCSALTLELHNFHKESSSTYQ